MYLDKSKESNFSSTSWRSFEVKDAMVRLQVSRGVHKSSKAFVTRAFFPRCSEPSWFFICDFPVTNSVASGIDSIDEKSSVHHSVTSHTDVDKSDTIGKIDGFWV